MSNQVSHPYKTDKIVVLYISIVASVLEYSDFVAQYTVRSTLIFHILNYFRQKKRVLVMSGSREFPNLNFLLGCNFYF